MIKFFRNNTKIRSVPNLIDIYLTTYQRPKLLQKTLDSIIEAIDKSKFKHRLTIFSDATDRATFKVLDPVLDKIHMISTPSQVGLPFSFNLLHDYSQNLIARTEQSPFLICYIQDDALIKFPDSFFDTIVSVSKEILPEKKLGIISGFYSPLHPGFEKISHNGISILKSDTVDGKNMIMKPDLLKSIGPLSWYDSKGNRRGNPGPGGSGFDLWQWRDSPRSTSRQKRINLVIPGLIQNLGSGDQSTWGNPGDIPEVISQRIHNGNYYKTRNTIPYIGPEDYFKPENTNQ